jgi:hypothetical protein
MSEALPSQPAADAQPAVDADVAMLARLAAVGMAAVERVHERLLTTEDNRELADLARGQSRLSRCVRQTLLLKSRLAREAELAAARGESRKPVVATTTPGQDRFDDLEEAMARIAHAVGHSSDKAQDTLSERLHAELADWIEIDAFAEADLDRQVRWLCGRLGYPAHLADTWRELEHPDDMYPPWGSPPNEAGTDEAGPDRAETPPDPPASHTAALPLLEPPHESSA